jgi:hypothetical protein
MLVIYDLEKKKENPNPPGKRLRKCGRGQQQSKTGLPERASLYPIGPGVSRGISGVNEIATRFC